MSSDRVDRADNDHRKADSFILLIIAMVMVYVLYVHVWLDFLRRSHTGKNVPTRIKQTEYKYWIVSVSWPKLSNRQPKLIHQFMEQWSGTTGLSLDYSQLLLSSNS